MGNNTVADDILYESAMRELFVRMALEGNISDAHHIVRPKIFPIRDHSLRVEPHCRNGDDFVGLEAQIIFLVDRLIQLPQLTLFPSCRESPPGIFMLEFCINPTGAC